MTRPEPPPPRRPWASASTAADGPLGRVQRWSTTTSRELLGLLGLLLAGIVVTAVLWWRALPGPAPVVPDGAAPQAASSGAEAVPGDPSSTPEAATIVVHVTGAVASAGVVRLPAGARVTDAIAAVGGPALDAATSALNLARPLADGEQIVVPRIGETPPPVAAGPATTGPAPDPGTAMRPDGTLDLNRASVAELEELPGIGPVLAERIVAWREANGPFSSPGDLREVAGIGERTFQALAPLVGV